MSHVPQIFEADDPYSVPMPDRLTHVMAVAVFGIIIGTLGLLTLPFAAEPNWADFSGFRGGVYGTRSPIAVWGVVSTTVYSGLCLMALVGGAGCMRFRPWGRWVMLGYGVLSVLMFLPGVYFHWRIIQLSTSGQAVPNFAFRFTTVAEWGVWIYGSLLGGYALWTMLRRDVRHAFKEGFAGDLLVGGPKHGT